jgi:hypothetical protein
MAFAGPAAAFFVFALAATFFLAAGLFFAECSVGIAMVIPGMACAAAFPAPLNVNDTPRRNGKTFTQAPSTGCTPGGGRACD